MMKKYICGIILLFTIVACTQNEGYIGNIFGSWELTDYSINGTSVSFDENDETFISFQGEIVMVTHKVGKQQPEKSFGTFSLLDNDSILRLIFNHSSDTSPSGTGGFAAPTWLGMISSTMDMTIIKSTGSQLKLIWVDNDDTIRTYTFQRTW